MQGHLKIYRDFQNIMDLHQLSGIMPIRDDFDAQFEVIIHDREGWDHEQGAGTQMSVSLHRVVSPFRILRHSATSLKLEV
jgi:hypothetical protein